MGVGRFGAAVFAAAVFAAFAAAGALGPTIRGLGLGSVAAFALRPLVALQKWIAFKLLLHVCRKFHVGKLQQLDRLLQLRRHDQGLTLAKL